jgi:hypothetical protein
LRGEGGGGRDIGMGVWMTGDISCGRVHAHAVRGLMGVQHYAEHRAAYPKQHGCCWCCGAAVLGGVCMHGPPWCSGAILEDEGFLKGEMAEAFS